jgi:chromosome segregation ATPase
VDNQLSALDRKTDAAFKRIDDASKNHNARATEIERRISSLETRLVAVEVNYLNVNRTLEELRNDVRELTRSFYKTGLFGGIIGGGGPTIVYIVAQAIGGQ